MHAIAVIAVLLVILVLGWQLSRRESFTPLIRGRSPWFRSLAGYDPEYVEGLDLQYTNDSA